MVRSLPRRRRVATPAVPVPRRTSQRSRWEQSSRPEAASHAFSNESRRLRRFPAPVPVKPTPPLLGGSVEPTPLPAPVPVKPTPPPLGGSIELRLLAEPHAGLPVAVDADVLAALEDDFEVAPVDRLVGPPAIDHTPFLTDERDELTVHHPRGAAELRLDERSPRSVQPPYRGGTHGSPTSPFLCRTAPLNRTWPLGRQGRPSATRVPRTAVATKTRDLVVTGTSRPAERPAPLSPVSETKAQLLRRCKPIPSRCSLAPA